MKKTIFTTLIIASALVAGYSINNMASSKSSPEYKIAVVDIQKVVLNSPEIKVLKANQEKQLQDLQRTINTAREEISKETDPAKSAKLEEKYRKEINEKEIALEGNYNKQLSTINNKIKTSVAEKAHSMNYNIVLSKNSILFGGEDITDKVIEGVK